MVQLRYLGLAVIIERSRYRGRAEDPVQYSIVSLQF